MIPRATAAIAIVFAFLATQSCREKAPWPPVPAAIQFGEDACGACSMIIGDPTYAAQIVSRQGAVQIFDDIGCMLTKVTTSTDPAGVFVRAFDGSRWIRGDQAYVLTARDIASPMGYGFAAFATRPDAETAASTHPGGSVAELKTLLGSPPPSPAPRQGAGTSEMSLKGEVSE
jgi:copper chaperone NosL